MRKFLGAKKKRQAASLLLAAVLAAVSVSGTGTLPVSAEEPAAAYTGGLCEHHTEHDETCGYREAVEESPCNHEHTDDCYRLDCPHEHDEDCGYTEDCYVLDCSHTHDEACGYQEAVEEKSCGYVCEICSGSTADGGSAESEPECTCETLCSEGNVNADCPVCGAGEADLTLCKGEQTTASVCSCKEKCTEGAVNTDCPVCGEEGADLDQCAGKEQDDAVKQVQDMIDALPTAEELKAMDTEGQQAVYASLQDAYDAYEALSDDEKLEVTGAEIMDALFDVFNGMTNALADSGFTVEGGEVNNDYTLSGNTLTIKTSKPLTISTTGDSAITGQIVIQQGTSANLTLNGVNIKGKNSNDNMGIAASSAIELSSGSSLTLTLVQGFNNSLEGGGGSSSLGAPAIHVPEYATLKVLCASGTESNHICNENCGLLSAVGGNSEHSSGGVGIGGGIQNNGPAGIFPENCGTVLLLGGT